MGSVQRFMTNQREAIEAMIEHVATAPERAEERVKALQAMGEALLGRIEQLRRQLEARDELLRVAVCGTWRERRRARKALRRDEVG